MAHTYALVDDQGRQLDAHFSLEGGDIVMHSRGGTKGDGATNVDYTAGLHLILRRLNDGDVRVRAAWVDSVTVQALPLAERAILSADEGREPPERIHSLLTSRMKTVRSDPVSQAKGGNSTRRIRIQTSFPGASDEFAGLLKGIALEGDTRSRERLPAETLNLATPEFVWAAVQQLLEGEVEHSFGPSTDFDLIADDGRRLPPKAIFGVALSLALGGASILPRHFTGGETSQCFRLLRAAGYQVVPKDTPAEPEETGEDIDADQEWIEGKKRLRVHRSR